MKCSNCRTKLPENAKFCPDCGTKAPDSAQCTLESLPEILTAQHIADYLHISRRRVYELFQVKPEAGGIPNFEIGLSKRVDKRDFVAWMEARKQEKAVGF